MFPEKQSPSADPPALFREVGPLVDDWEKYLRDLAEDLDEWDNSSTPPRQEDKLFLQVELSKMYALFMGETHVTHSYSGV